MFRRFEVRKKVRLMFARPKKALKVNSPFLAVINRQKRYAWFIFTVNCNKTQLPDAF